jgi:hypothetical protein
MDSKTFLSKIQVTPPTIRTWFASEEVSSMVRTINQHFNIQKADKTVIPKLLARLEVKDIEPDYFAGELSEELKLDRDKALGISSEIKRTILGPLGKEFSDFGINISLLDKFQIPAIKGLSPSAVSAAIGALKIIQDANTAASSSIQKPATLSDIGWSKIPSAVSPTPTAQPASIIPTPPRPATIPAPAPTAPAKPAEPAPAPMMLHEDAIFKPAEKNEGFILPKPGAGVEMHMGTSAPQAPIRPAVLEFGGVKIPVPKPPTPTTGGAYRGEFGSSLSSTPVAGAGPRNVSQIMPVARVSVPLPVPKPPVPITTPPTPPRPLQATIHIPQPPTPPQSPKPIVKDFL